MLIAVVTTLSAALLLPPAGRCGAARALPRAPSVGVRACAGAGDGGPLAGPFWDAFVREARDEAARLGLSVEDVSFAGGKLSVLHPPGSARWTPC